jgi:uncharacterized protein
MLQRSLRALLILLALVGAPLGAPWAQLSAQKKEPVIPPPRGMVNDFAGVIPADQLSRITRIADMVKAQSGGEIVVVTLPDIGDRDVADIALKIGRDWKVGANSAIGDKTRNTGVIVLVVPKETSSDGKGHVRIEVGQGTEGFITDGQAGDIQREAIPLFQRKDYGTAIELMTQRIAERYAGNFGFSLDSVARMPRASSEPVGDVRSGRRSGGFPPVLALIIFVVIWMIITRGRGGGCLWLLLSSGRGGGGGWSGGGGGGGGFGGFGGGGGFSGGGSSGSW